MTNDNLCRASIFVNYWAKVGAQKFLWLFSLSFHKFNGGAQHVTRGEYALMAQLFSYF